MGITALLGLLLTGLTSAQDAGALPGVVFSESSHRAFCSNGDRRVVALDLATGKPIWSSQEKGWPLAVMGPDLVVATLANDPHAFYLKVLGVADGQFRVMSQPIVLPAWAKPVFNYDRSEGYEFAIRAEPFSDAKLHVYWRARKWQGGGIAMNPRFAQAAAKEESGGLEFHVGSGYLSIIDPYSEPLTPGVLEGQPDPTRHGAHLLSEMVRFGEQAFYLAESSSGPTDPVRPVELVCLPASGNSRLWAFSLGNRNVPRLRM